MQIEDDFWQNLINQKKMMLFLYDSLRLFFEEYEGFDSQSFVSNQQVKFSYCHFLLEICQSRSISYLKIFGQENQLTQSYFDTMYSNYLRYVFEIKFASKDQSKTQGVAIFQFEKLQYEISCQYLSCLIQRKNILNILNKDNINLQEFYQQTIHFLKQRNKISQTFKQLHPNFYIDPLIKEVLKGYTNYLNNSRYLVDRQLIVQQKQMKYDPSQECFILLDLEKNNFGRIKKVSEKSFEQIFGMKALHGQSLNIILPSEFAKVHDSFVLNFLENLDSDKNNLIHSRFVLGINNQGFAVPIVIKFTIESNLNSQLSGLIGNIKLTDTSYMYLMVNLDTSKFLNFTKDFYDRYFGRLGIKFNQTQNIYLKNIFPAYDDILQTLDRQTEKDKPIHKELIGFFPQSSSNCEFIYNTYQQETSRFKYFQVLSKIAECLKVDIKIYQIIRAQVRVLIFQFIEIKKSEEQDVYYEIQKLQDQEQYPQIDKRVPINYQETNVHSPKYADQSLISEFRSKERQEHSIIHMQQVPLSYEKQLSSFQQRHSIFSLQAVELKKLLPSFNRDENNIVDDNVYEKNHSLSQIETNRLCTIKTPRMISPIASQRSIFFDQDRFFDSYNAKIISENNLKMTDYTQKKSDLTCIKHLEFSSNNNMIKSDQLNQEYVKKQKQKSKINFNQQIIEEIEKDQELKGQNDHIPFRKQSVYQFNTKLKGKHHLFLAEILLGFSLASMIAIGAIALIYFFESKNLFNRQKQSLQHTSWPLTMRSATSALMYETQNVKIVDKELFAPKQEYKEFQFSNRQRIQVLLQTLRDGLYEIIISDKEEYPYFQDIFSQGNPIDYVEMKDAKSLYGSIEKRQTSFYELLSIYVVYLDSYSTKLYQVYNEEAFNNMNFFRMRDRFDEIQYIIDQSANDNLTNIQKIYFEIIYVITIISTSLLIVSFLLNVFIRKRVQKQLALFATFSPNQLKRMILHQENGLKKFINIIKKNDLETQILKKSVLNGDINKNQYNETIMKLNSAHVMKTKGISNTTRFPLISLKFLIFSIFFQALVLTQPILNSVLINVQIEECDINLHLMSNLYEMRGHIASNMYLNTALIYQRLYPQNDFYEQDYFDKGLIYLNSINDQKVSNLTDVIQQELDKKRYKQEYYDNFLHKLLKGDMCEALNNYPQFMEDIDFKFDYSVCSQLRNSILTKGFQVSLNYAINVISTIQEILNDPKNIKSRETFKQWERDTYKMVEFDQFIEYMMSIINVMKKFIIFMGDDYINSMENIQKYLLIFYCISLFALFLISWWSLKSYLKKISNQSNHLFSFIDKQILVSNTYLHKFFKNN